MSSYLIDHPQNRKSSAPGSYRSPGSLVGTYVGGGLAGSYLASGLLCNMQGSIPTAMRAGELGTVQTMPLVASRKTFLLHKVRLPQAPESDAVPTIFIDSEDEMRYGASAYVGESAERVMVGMDEATPPEHPPLPLAE